jgi:hypothetical protein
MISRFKKRRVDLSTFVYTINHTHIWNRFDDGPWRCRCGRVVKTNDPPRDILL